MSEKLYAQFNDDGVCTCVGTPNITGIEAEYKNLGQKYVDGLWLDIIEAELVVEYTPTNIEIAQAISDLQADLLIAGVI